MSEPTPVSPAPKNNLLITIIVAVIVLAIILGSWVLIKNQAMAPTGLGENKTPIRADNDQSAPLTAAEDDGYPDEIYSYAGAVAEINPDSIMIEVKAERNYLAKDTVIKILTDDQTEYVKISLPLKVELDEKGQPSGDILIRTDIARSDLAIGDEVTAISYTNIKGKTEITANRVELKELR